MDLSDINRLGSVDMTSHVDNVLKDLERRGVKITTPHLISASKSYARKHGFSDDDWLKMILECVLILNKMGRQQRPITGSTRAARRTVRTPTPSGKDLAGNQGEED